MANALTSGLKKKDNGSPKMKKSTKKSKKKKKKGVVDGNAKTQKPELKQLPKEAKWGDDDDDYYVSTSAQELTADDRHASCSASGRLVNTPAP